MYIILAGGLRHYLYTKIKFNKIKLSLLPQNFVVLQWKCINYIKLLCETGVA